MLDDGEEAGSGGGGKVAKRSLLENTLEEAMVKAHKLFAEAGDVETTFAAEGGKNEEEQQEEGKSTSKSKTTRKHSILGSLGLGRTRSKRHGTFDSLYIDSLFIFVHLCSSLFIFVHLCSSLLFYLLPSTVVDILNFVFFSS